MDSKNIDYHLLYKSMAALKENNKNVLKRGSAYSIDNLVVNQEPEIPLRVGLNKVDLSVKIIDLKKKNLERFEII